MYGSVTAKVSLELFEIKKKELYPSFLKTSCVQQLMVFSYDQILINYSMLKSSLFGPIYKLKSNRCTL